MVHVVLYVCAQLMAADMLAPMLSDFTDPTMILAKDAVSI